MSFPRIISLTSRNVFTNLACEQRLFEKASSPTLLFYVNSPCVVMGRTQNPYYEVNVDLAHELGIPISRRRSGGGTVVHDVGNLNICFMNSRQRHDTCANMRVVRDTLRDDFGISADITKRGDLLVNDGEFKVSGSAYRLDRDRAYHHLTLLVHSDLSLLRRLLKSPYKSYIEATGTKSISSKVDNVANYANDNAIDIPSVIQALAKRWKEGVTQNAEGNLLNTRVESVSPSMLEKDVGSIQQEKSELSDRKWVFTQTPKFTFSAADVQVNVKKGGIVDSVSVPQSNDADAALIDKAFKGVGFGQQSLAAALDELQAHPGSGLSDKSRVVGVIRDVVQRAPPEHRDEHEHAESGSS